jgi:sedoheptulokinase
MGQQFVGIDIGTTTISGVIFNPETGKLRPVTKKNTSRLDSLNSWEDRQDPDIILSIVQEILDEFLGGSEEIRGIGITGQMHGILYVGKDGNALGPLFTWQDRRGDVMYKDGISYADYLAVSTGYALAAGYGLVTHFYNAKNSLIPVGTHKMCTIMDYVVMKLAKNKAPVMDPSNAASFGLYNLQNSSFDRGAMDKFFLPHDILPEIVPSGKIAGYYNKQIFVCNAIGDNQASFLGAVNDLEKSVLINIGTGSQVSVYTEQYLKNETLESRPFPDGGYILVGSALCGGYSLEILKIFYEEVIKMFGGPRREMDFYNALNSLKYSKEDSNESLNVEVLFRGTRMDPKKRGVINNITPVNFTPANLILGFLNGICNELYRFYQQIPEKRRNKIKRIIGSGNAIRMNSLLRSIIEETFGIEMIIPENYEQAAFGACLNAMVSGKYVESYHDLGKFITNRKIPFR